MVSGDSYYALKFSTIGPPWSGGGWDDRADAAKDDSSTVSTWRVSRWLNGRLHSMVIAALMFAPLATAPARGSWGQSTTPIAPPTVPATAPQATVRSTGEAARPHTRRRSVVATRAAVRSDRDRAAVEHRGSAAIDTGLRQRGSLIGEIGRELRTECPDRIVARVT